MALSPGVYTNEEDRTFGVPTLGTSIGGIVLSADRGPTDVTFVSSKSQLIQLYGEPKSDTPALHTALVFLRDAPAVQIKRVIVDAVASSVDVDDSQSTPEVTFTVNAENPGSWGDNISVEFTDEDETDEIFTMNVYYNGSQVETFTVSKNPDLKDGYGNNLYIEDVVESSVYVRVADDTTSTELPAMDTMNDLTGGSDDTTAPTDSDLSTGWDAFSNKDVVDVNILLNAGYSTETVQNKMITIAEGRGDCFAILDTPQADAGVAADTVTYRNDTLNANTSWASLYAPWVNYYDQYNDREIALPPSGFAGGIHARTAEVAEVWDAPAGMRRGIITANGVTKIYNEAERDQLYKNGVNPIQEFTGMGISVWGQKTLQSFASSTDRINVRKLLIHIQESLEPALMPFVFEANTAFVRNNINTLITSFMEDIQQRDGVYDFAVITDESINTPTVIDNNELRVELYIKPTRTAEFIKLTVINTPTGVSFQ